MLLEPYLHKNIAPSLVSRLTNRKAMESQCMDWKTWSPLQSAQTKDVCAHMTESERRTVALRGGLYGLWCAATFAIPISQAMVFRNPVTLTVAAILCSIHIIAIPFWLRSQRRFLCGTVWAKEQGVNPNDLRLFSCRLFGKQSDHTT